MRVPVQFYYNLGLICVRYDKTPPVDTEGFGECYGLVVKKLVVNKLKGYLDYLNKWGCNLLVLKLNKSDS